MKSKLDKILKLICIKFSIIILLLIFGFWGESIVSFTKPFIKESLDILPLTQITMILYFIGVIIVIWKIKKIVEHIPTIVMTIIILYMIGWFFTFGYTSSRYSVNNSDSAGYSMVDEFIYIFNGSINFFVIIATLISLYALTDERKKERLNKKNIPEK